ncbi:MAG: hypothetical protein KBB14_00665 [Thermoanaerobaculia bacterium]|nr:hypothetical protein [Thermoanaerobaculia bacterium]
MRDVRKVPASTRSGQLGSYWGNLVMPAGEMTVLDRFSFEDGAGIVNIVKRVLVNPLDLTTKLYHYERVDRFNALEESAGKH